MVSPNTFDPSFWKSLSEPFPLLAHSAMASPMRLRSYFLADAFERCRHFANRVLIDLRQHLRTRPKLSET